MKAWNIKQIAKELQESYLQCNNDFERSMWKVYVSKDCKNIHGNKQEQKGTGKGY